MSSRLLVSRTARLPFIVGMVVLFAALVTLVVRVQGDDAGIGAAGDDADGITAEDPDVDRDTAAPGADDGPADDDPTADGPATDETDDGPADRDPTAGADEDGITGPDERRDDDGVQAAQSPDQDAATGAADASTAGERDPAERSDADAPSTATRGDDQGGAVAAEAPDDEVTRDRVPGLDPLPDTGATPVALGLLSLGALAIVRGR